MNTKLKKEKAWQEKSHRVDPRADVQGFDQHNDVEGQQRHLRDFVNQLRTWLYEVEQMGIPKFGETGYRLRSLKLSLQEHFDCCRRRRGEGLNRDFEEQSHLILDRLDSLINRLEMPDPPFDSWQELEHAIADFSDDLEQLETKFVNCYCD